MAHTTYEHTTIVSVCDLLTETRLLSTVDGRVVPVVSHQPHSPSRVRRYECSKPKASRLPISTVPSECVHVHSLRQVVVDIQASLLAKKDWWTLF